MSEAEELNQNSNPASPHSSEDIIDIMDHSEHSDSHSNHESTTHFDSTPNSTTPTNESNSHSDFTPSSTTPTMESVIRQMIPVYPHRREERKRRRLTGNTDNTLDGLVAKRAEMDPVSKRYQTENDAIVLPDDEAEMKRMENDPDVATRVCSICGYQGKWVSEMIRHKRVHTNDRPFKCKYCSRTSKWKADLVRHVAKTHGIRVVSKYSRSKAFDVNAGHDGGRMESLSPVSTKSVNSIPVIKKAQLTKDSMQCFNTMMREGGSNESVSTSFRCLTCFFEQESIEVLINHLHNVHNISPFECLQCKQTFDGVYMASAHCSLPGSICTPLSIKINFSPIHSSPKSLHSLSLSSATTSSPTSIRSDSDSSSSMGAQDEDLVHVCNECPFRSESEEKLIIHKQGHGSPKGPFNYKCAFCSFYAKKKSAIERHMSLHTSRPEEFMGQVERNLVTSATLEPPKLSISALPTNLPLASMLAARLQGMATSPLFNTGLSTISNEQLLSAAANQLISNLLYQQAPAPIMPTTTLPDMNLLRQLANQPLPSFNLSSLLELHKNSTANVSKFEQTTI